jgi:hypothetical protein
MDAKLIFVSAYFVGTVLSFALFLRVLQLSVGLWSKKPTCQRLPTGSDADNPAEFDQIFRA